MKLDAQSPFGAPIDRTRLLSAVFELVSDVLRELPSVEPKEFRVGCERPVLLLQVGLQVTIGAMVMAGGFGSSVEKCPISAHRSIWPGSDERKPQQSLRFLGRAGRI